MTEQDPRRTEHEITVSAAAADVYRLLAEVENWPLIFPPSMFVEYAVRGTGQERIRIWADVNGQIKNWTSHRVLEPGALSIQFRQEVPASPIAAMGGAWVIEPTGPESCGVRLLHDFRAVGDDPEKLAWIETAVDRNSRSELAALRRYAEQMASPDALTMTFEDTVRIAGPAKRAYDFINDAQHWPDRLPHVDQVSLREETPGLQVLSMSTRTKDGATHTTESVRICFPGDRIAYKQTVLPALLAVHTGCWQFAEENGTAVVTSRHTVVINEENIPAVLGDGAGIPEARQFIRAALGGNSLATLGHAKEHAEALG
ncbi:aromatase/cyclase [Streptomyces sp. GMR22]|uniref:aromatase/cyclase n=1 Tax=Streptomyces sp. GMR22 TaxID=2759524 RepID=UPI0015FDC43B|nr:aromatase/cyclase [Streptomyces sp. GMR22]MBA6437042.1 SRPBCC family protein [Streptomyces sp. GMR22]